MKEKHVINGKYPSYSFRLHPDTVKELEKIKEKDSWNTCFKKLASNNQEEEIEQTDTV